MIASDNGFPEAQTAAAQIVVKVHEKQQNAPQWQVGMERKDLCIILFC